MIAVRMFSKPSMNVSDVKKAVHKIRTAYNIIEDIPIPMILSK